MLPGLWVKGGRARLLHGLQDALRRAPTNAIEPLQDPVPRQRISRVGDHPQQGEDVFDVRGLQELAQLLRAHRRQRSGSSAPAAGRAPCEAVAARQGGGGSAAAAAAGP